MSPRLRLALVGFIALLVVVFLFAFLNRRSGVPDVPIISNGNALPVVPVDPRGKNVTWAFATYNFFGRIRDLKPGDNGTQLTLYTPQNKNVPIFTLTNVTRVFKTDKKQIAPAAVSDLKTGINVAVIATYDLKTFKWTTRQVFIPVTSLPTRTATPSPAQKPSATPTK